MPLTTRMCKSTLINNKGVVLWCLVLLLVYFIGTRWRLAVPEPDQFTDASQSLRDAYPMFLEAGRYLDQWSEVQRFSSERTPKKLLLVTKFRGGSTFIGDLFAQGTDCFYWFEPLRVFIPNFDYLSRMVNPSIIECDFYKLENETVVPLPNNLTDPRVVALIQTMTCDISRLDERVVDNTRSDAFHSPRAQNYSDCRHSGGEVNYCEHFMEDACRSSVINVAKTVRTPFYLVPKVLEAVPDLKVVYYTRDPRAMMHSRKDQSEKRHMKQTKDLIEATRDLCLRMMHDHVTYLAADAAYPGRILHVVYEALAFNPVEETTRMYRFMGMELPAAIETWIEENTKADESDTAIMATHKNSTWTATRWLEGLDDDLIVQMTEQCEDILNVLGYPLKM